MLPSIQARYSVRLEWAFYFTNFLGLFPWSVGDLVNRAKEYFFMLFIFCVAGFSLAHACCWPSCSKPKPGRLHERSRNLERFPERSRVTVIRASLGARRNRFPSMEVVPPSQKSDIPSMSGYTDPECHQGPREDSLISREGAAPVEERKTPPSEIEGPDLSVSERSAGPYVQFNRVVAPKKSVDLNQSCRTTLSDGQSSVPGHSGAVSSIRSDTAEIAIQQEEEV